MRTRVPAAMSFLILLVLLLGFLAGCGGDQAGNGGSQGDEKQGGSQQQGEQQGDQQQGSKQQGGEATNQGPPPEKVALGSIQSVDPEKRRIVMKPAFEAQGGEQITFNVRKNAEIRVNDQEADLSDVETGKQAQISYVTNKDVNRATSVEVVGDGG